MKMFTVPYKTEINVSHCNIHLRTDDITRNLYKDVVNLLVDDAPYIAIVHTAPAIYGGDVRELHIHCGKVEPANICNGTYFINFDPASPNYKKLQLYYNGTFHSFEFIDDYFSYTP